MVYGTVEGGKDWEDRRKWVLETRTRKVPTVVLDYYDRER